MHCRLLITAAITLGLGLSACKQEGTGVSNNQTGDMVDGPGMANSGTMASGNMTGAASEMDATYVQNAAASDMFEIETSRLALAKATSPAIKTYAQMMIDEHGKSSTDLKAAMAGAAIVVPAGLPTEQSAKLETLRDLSGAAFDRQYLADQRAGHQETLAKINAYLATAAAGPLKDHASKVTGVVQKHLNSLENIK